MISACFNSPYFRGGAFLVWLLLAVGGLLSYTGSSLNYILFSLVFLYLLVDGLYRQLSLGYAFLVVFLWLGFWLKLVVHLCLNYSYLEPVGYFDGSAEAWDAVLTASMVGAVAVALTKMLFAKYAGTRWRGSHEYSYCAPSWYPSARLWLWGGAWIAIILFPASNAIYGIAQSGPVSTLIMPWPLNAIIAWFLGFGLVTWVVTLVYWDHSIKRGWMMGLLGVLTEACFSTLSSLSRAGYIFQTLPYLMVLFTKRFQNRQVKKRTKFAILLVWLCLLAVSLSSVMVFRYSHAPVIDAIVSKRSSSKLQAETKVFPSLEEIAGHASHISNLIVDRWIGIEGVMAVTAYPGKKIELFTVALQERRERGKVDLYTKEIARAGVTDNDAKKNQYATIPGGTAFFYYTGSLWAILAGMVCLTSLMLFSERVVLFLTRNPYMCAFWGMGIAQTVASFGLGVVQTATYYAACFATMTLIWAVQTLSPAAKQ